MIREMIDAEPPAKPLSDSRIANTLNERGIEVARRTVAKYREALGIASSTQRKRLI
jgi:RNA polymerase sigma-54 factor